MTLGEKISLLRKERGLTQAELGNDLGVTYQAVSKWERDESMPDFGMISKLAKLFGVSISYFENSDGNEEQNNETTVTFADNVEVEEKAVEPTSQVLGVCTVCGKYTSSDNVWQESPKLICTTCHDNQVAQEKRAQQERAARVECDRRELSSRFIKRSVIAAIVAGLISLVIFITQLVNIETWKVDFELGTAEYVGISIASFVMLFTWIFQLFFDGAVRSVTLAGLFFIRLPGIIFSADLDGLIFLIIMKVLLFIISALVFVVAIVFMSFVAMVVSLFTFIPVVVKIIRRNEDLLGD